MHGPGLTMLLAAFLLAGDFAAAADDEPDAKAPPVPEEATAPSSTYRGEELSFNFQDIEVRAALLLIADFAGTNLVASDTVSGNVTLRLNQVPWDQALDLILDTRGLGKRVEGNVLLVAPADELAERERLELTNRQTAL